jgi:hypothetical protein
MFKKRGKNFLRYTKFWNWAPGVGLARGIIGPSLHPHPYIQEGPVKSDHMVPGPWSKLKLVLLFVN